MLNLPEQMILDHGKRSFDVLLDLMCWYFFESTCTFIRDIGLQFSFSAMFFFWFGYQGNASGVIE
jgi:hypothetical protein